MAAINLTQAASSSTASLIEELPDTNKKIDLSQYAKLIENTVADQNYGCSRDFPRAAQYLIEKFTFAPKCPEKLRNLAKTLRYINEATLSNRTFPQIASPRNNLFQAAACHYKEKYGIPIHLFTPDELLTHIQQPDSFQEPEGCILYHPKNIEGHVAPVILHPSKEAVVLDSLGFKAWYNPGGLAWKCSQALKDNNITTFITGVPRQADYFSCRIDAFITLRNALLDLKKFPCNSLKDRLLSVELQHYSMDQDYQYELPHTWDYTSQISNKAPGAETTHISRDLFSTSQKKRDNPQTVEQFRKKHKMPMVYEIALQVGQYQELIDNGTLPQTLNEPYRVETRTNANGREATWIVKTEDFHEHNAYLLSKGWKLATKAAQQQWKDSQ